MKQMLAVAVLSLASTMPLIHPPSAGYAVSVNIRPESVSNNPYELLARERTTYVCTVEVTDLSSKTTMTGPKVVLNSGDKQTRTKNINGYQIDYTVSISRNADQASWDVVVRDGPLTLTRQHSEAMLRAVSRR
jgi:hypothetical protein